MPDSKSRQRTNGEPSENQPSRTRTVRVDGNQFGAGSTEQLFEDIRESDIDVEGLDELDEPEIAYALRKLLSRDFILGYADEADLTEIRWLARNVVDMLEATFPPERSVVQGSYRKVLLRDEHDGRTALSGRDRAELQQTVLAILIRISRSEGGWQMDKIADSHSHNIVERRDDRQSRTLFGGA
jgi:hypothetical protein